MATPHAKAAQEAQAVSFAQLEPSKENIQPLLRSTGKRMRSLAQNLRQTPKALTEKQERERLQWEQALKSDLSNDPLHLWLKYIKWVKLNFTCPTGEKAQLLPIIERCTSTFKNDQRYTNNKQYIKLWLEYAHLSRDSMEIFKFLHANKIGAQLALFWRGWAIVAEQQNQFDLVDRIFTEAKQIGAQPFKDIERSYQQFSTRMRKKISNQNIELQPNIHHGSVAYPNNPNSRATLGQITENSSSHRKDHIQPHGFGEQIAIKPPTNRKFGIYCEKETTQLPSTTATLPPVNAGWRDLGTGYNRSKENDGIATAWNHQHFLETQHKPRIQQAQSTFAIPVDDELKNHNKPFRESAKSDDTICTHARPAMGEWKPQGRYLCASFCDANVLRYDGFECSFEEARCRVMKVKWNKELEEKERSESMMMEEDDMMMTMNVGRILYNKSCPDLSIPSTIKEEPQSLKSSINTEKHVKRNRNRKRRCSDEDDHTQEDQEIADKNKPHKKRFKFAVLNDIHPMEEDRTYDVFAELTTTTNLTTNTIGSHFETPLRKLDFATPSHHTLVDQTKCNASSEATQDIGSMTEFFKNPIQITDKRMGDTPTVTHIKPRIIHPTQTVTFHSKAAMNDIVKIFGASDGNREEEEEDAIMVEHGEVQAESDHFGIYEDTATIHTKIDVAKIEIEAEVPLVHRLSIQPNDDESELPLPLPMIEEEEEEEVKQSVDTMDPLDAATMKQYESSLLAKYHSHNGIMDERGSAPPIAVESLLNGETDIELDDEDAYLNVTEYLKRMSKEEHHVFVVNDLSQEDDTERMLLVDCPSSLRSYHISQLLTHDGIASQHMEYALVQSVYLYNNASFTLSKITDTFQTLSDVLCKTTQQNTDLHEKFLLYLVTEIMRIISQLHAKNIIHSNLKLDSFLLKLSECNSISMDWSDHVPPVHGWQNFGLLLHDIHECIKLDDFIDTQHINNRDSFGCFIQDHDPKHIAHRFQQWIGNKAWCYEVDVFSIFVMVIQLLTQQNDVNIISKINYNEDIIKQMDAYRAEKGLKELQNKELWNTLLNMLLMKQENDTSNGHHFSAMDTMSISNRQQYLKQCYEYCAAQLMDLENFTPKLQIILARLDRMIQT